MDSWIKFILFSGLWFAPGAEFDGRSVRQMASSNGLCRYGNRVDCCWGWTRQSWGHCQHLNECGLKPRPCKHRCMNTQGSYKCYCLNGYMLMPDGTCGNLRTCGMANCQYGCEVLKGEVRCQCPSPGLQLAPDGRTCVDVDECATGLAVCPRCRKCINTFGSYICKCHDGFDLQYVNGKHQCIDVNECALRPSRCSSFATCYNTRGSYKCKCKDGYRGTGRDCKPIPKVVIEPPRPHKLPPSHHNHIPDIDQRRTTTTLRPVVTQRPALPVAPKTTTATTTLHPVVTQRPALPVTSKTTTTTTILHPVVTQKPALPVAPKVTTITTSTTTKTTTTTKATPTPRRPPAPTRIPERGDNSINWITNKHHRGDVYIPRVRPEDMLQEYEVLLGDEDDELNDDAESGFLSCTFDNGLCGWISDEGGDVHWETTPDPAGGLYLTIPEVGNKRTGRGARLVIPLAPPWNEGNLCLSFRHKLAGHHVGMLQVFIKKGTQYNPSVWESTGGNRWRHTQITLWGKGLQSVVLKGERGRGRSGEMAVDDISVSKGSCTDEFLTPERKRKSSQ
ncbi:nephronectin a isoform X3 [Dunckerocampus dactyliophorus]|uniref:nephronectin a isoform X3 n=1 Tax=Dunckerocampus dactyliophorus TaxID=161453 RepID=UPI0024049726|nr:nephronectin a isoform X3 [Dunckerocampus dactyliophorus]